MLVLVGIRYASVAAVLFLQKKPRKRLCLSKASAAYVDFLLANDADDPVQVGVINLRAIGV